MYGHYPLPVIAEPDTKPWQGFGGVGRARTGSRAEQQAPLLEVLHRHGVAAYLCGHLHSAFGPRLHRLHAAPGGGQRDAQTLKPEP